MPALGVIIDVDESMGKWAGGMPKKKIMLEWSRHWIKPENATVLIYSRESVCVCSAYENFSFLIMHFSFGYYMWSSGWESRPFLGN